MRAVLADLDMVAKRCCPAELDRGHDAAFHTAYFELMGNTIGMTRSISKRTMKMAETPLRMQPWKLAHGNREKRLVDVGDTASRARVILESAREWINLAENPAVASNSRLKREMGLAVYRQARLEEAVGRPLSIGVYGASQAGKSYFVSALAKGQTGTVMASMGDREIDFLTEINPSGSKESTGLVTRLTRQTVAASNDFPVTIDLLSELDIVKIISNSFYNDVEQLSELDIQTRSIQVQQLLNKSISGSQGLIGVEDIIELNFYCDKHFSNDKYYSLLKQVGYWSRLEQLIPLANDDQRLIYFSILWDNSPRYTKLFQHLVQELARFGGARTVLCEAAALFDIENGRWQRSSSSVINVQTLDAVGTQDQRQICLVRAGNLTMTPIQTGVGTLSALASEITIAIAHQPHPFFSQADLLDFPGARSRHPVDRGKFEEASELPTEHFLRGKVAYLFERYCNSFGMTALLLCIGPSNQEVVGLNRLVEDWVSDAAGDRPDQREDSPVNLFVILTKFDTEFAADRGRATDESRWDARITASLRKPFGEQQSAKTNWLDRWDTVSTFKNTYWWRSPAADQTHLIRYGDNQSEVSLSPERVDYIEKLKLAYMSSDLVKKHFRDPLGAWNAALALNDGGASYVMSNLERVCKPELRARQIRRQIVSNLDKILDQLRPLYISTDAQDLQEAKLKTANAFMGVAASLVQKRRAGDFLAELTIDEHDAIALFDEIRSEMIWGDRSKSAKSAKATTVIDSDLAQMLGLSAPTEARSKSSSQTEVVVRAFISQWAFLVGKKFEDARMLEHFEIEPGFVNNICAEIVTALERQGGITHIAGELERHNFQHDGASSNWNSAATAAIILNDFLMYTTLQRDKGRIVSKVDGSSGTIFSTNPAKPDGQQELVLPEKSAQFSIKLMADWAVGFRDMIKQNAFVDIRDEKQLQENLKLGSVLKDAVSLRAE